MRLENWMIENSNSDDFQRRNPLRWLLEFLLLRRSYDIKNTEQYIKISSRGFEKWVNFEVIVGIPFLIKAIIFCIPNITAFEKNGNPTIITKFVEFTVETSVNQTI